MANTEATVLINLAVDDSASPAVAKATSAFNKAKNASDRYTKTLRLQEVELKRGKDAMLRAKAALEGATLSELRRMKAMQGSVDELKQKTAAEQQAMMATDAANDETAEAISYTDRLIQSLQIQEKQYREGAQAALLYKAQLAGANQEQLEQIAILHRSIEANKNSSAAMGVGGRQARFMRGMFGQMGHQVQDVAVQMQMGTDAMLVFGQQGSQIASLLGPWGSIAGAAISIGAAMSTFFTASGKAKKATSELEKTLESLNKTIKMDVSTSTRMLSQDFIDLATASSALAEVTLRQKYLEALKAGALANDSFSASTQRVIKLTRDLTKVTGDPTSFQASSAAARNLQEEFGLTADEAVALSSAINNFNLDPASMPQLETLLADMAMGAKSSSTEFVAFAANVLESARQMRTAEEQAEFLKEVMGVGLTEAIEKFGDQDLSSSLDDNAKAFENLRKSFMSEEKKLLDEYKANQLLITQQTGDDTLTRNLLLEMLQERHNKAMRELQAEQNLSLIDHHKKASTDRVKILMDENDQMMAELVKGHEEQQRERDRITSAYEGLELGVSEIDRIRAQEEQKLNILKEYAELSNMAEAEREAQRRMIIQESEDQIYQIQAAAAERQLNDQLKLIGGFEGMQKMGVSAISAIVKEGASMSDVFKQVGRTIVDNVIDSIVQMGVEYVKQQMIQKAIENSSAATSVATAAATGIGIATAMAPAAALTSLATGGTNAIGAQAGMASTAALSKAIALASFEGGGFTGTGARSGGVDGKGGFPAILHPNETVVDHTKGQGQGITIINNVDASGGGDVDQRIRVAMEVTSQQTVMQVQDLLRRQRLV
jgi:hypothetical protein